jgi:Mg2+ and Co2+ transporter CorA
MATHSSATYGRMARLVRFLPDAAPPLFADIADQFEVIQTMADGQREFLHGVIEFYQTVLSVHATLLGQTQNEKVQQLTEAGYAQNEEIKKISAWAAIFFAPTLIGTIYGMNFDHMPELHWLIGYPLALLGMVLGSVALYFMFKRLKWL